MITALSYIGSAIAGALLFMALFLFAKYKINKIEARSLTEYENKKAKAAASENASPETGENTGEITPEASAESEKSSTDEDDDSEIIVVSPKKLRFCAIAAPVLGVAAGALCFFRFGISLASVTALLFVGILAAAATVDICTMELSDTLNIAAAVVGVIAYFTMPGTGILERFIGAVCVSVPLLIITLIVPGGFGGGDIKLTAACGLFLGWKYMLLSALAAIIVAGAYGAILLVTKKADKKAHFAFGPFLCAGMAFCCFFGENLLSLYMTVFDLSRFF